MNYEEFYETLNPQRKTLKDQTTALQRLLKAIQKEVEGGDVKSLTRDLEIMYQTTENLMDAVKTTQDMTNAFDTRTYFENGDFTSQVLAYCLEKQVDVQGEFPIYEMFPYRVKIDAENQDVYLDRKKIQCMRPSSLVETIKASQDKLNKASFNAATFVNELAEAYDLALLKLGKRAGTDIYLLNLYKYMAPMSRFRKDYDKQSYAYDLARLYIQYMDGLEETKSGRRFQFGPSRQQDKAIRILDKEGKEQYLSTICFYE